MSGVIDLVFIQFFDQVGIIHPNRSELLVRLLVFSFQRSRDIFRADDQFLHVAFGQVLLELAVGNRLNLGRKKVLLQVDNQENA